MPWRSAPLSAHLSIMCSCTVPQIETPIWNCGTATHQFSDDNNNICATQWVYHQWNTEWTDNPTRLRMFIPDTGTYPLEWPSQEEPGSGLTTSAPVSDVSAPACTNGVWPLLRPVSVAQKHKPSTMSSSNVQSIDLPTDCTDWRFWTMRQPNGCSTPALKSSVAKQWMEEELTQKEEGSIHLYKALWKHEPVPWQTIFKYSGRAILTSACRWQKQGKKWCAMPVYSPEL